MHRNSTAVWAIVLVGLVGLALPGCSWFNGSSAATQPALIPAANPPIADVPIPAGFTMNTSKSRARILPTSGLRFVDHQYTGSDGYLNVVRFYRDQMPSRGWTLGAQAQNSDGSFTLNYSKNLEDAVITISEGTIYTYVSVQIYPTARAGGR